MSHKDGNKEEMKDNQEKENLGELLTAKWRETREEEEQKSARWKEEKENRMSERQDILGRQRQAGEGTRRQRDAAGEQK